MPVAGDSYHRRMIFVLPLAVMGLAIVGAAVTAQSWRVVVFLASTAVAVITTVMHLA